MEFYLDTAGYGRIKGMTYDRLILGADGVAYTGIYGGGTTRWEYLEVGNRGSGTFYFMGDGADSIMTASYNNLIYGWDRGGNDTDMSHTIEFLGYNNNHEEHNYFEVGGITDHSVNGDTRYARFFCPLQFTQTDGNEFIDSIDDGYIDYRATTGHRFGDGTNQTMFEADGTLEFNGTATVWNDLQFQVSSARTNPANVSPTWETFTPTTSEYAFSVDDQVDTYANEIPHWWKQGTTGNAHMHVTTKAVPAQEQKARFTVTFAYADTDEVWVEAPLTAELTIPINTLALTNFYLDLGNITLTNYLMEAQMRCRVERVAKSAGGTEYVGDIFITQVGVHFEKNTLGSRTENGK